MVFVTVGLATVPLPVLLLLLEEPHCVKASVAKPVPFSEFSMLMHLNSVVAILALEPQPGMPLAL